MSDEPRPVADYELSKDVKFWKSQIELSEKVSDKFIRKGRKILKRYRDVRSPREEASTRFNVLWSNVQTRLPALYARNPKPVVDRRYKDRDPVGRVASEVLERSIDYTITHCNDFYTTVRNAILDYELPGRGTAWVRYEPRMEAAKHESPPLGSEITNDSDADPDASTEQLAYEETKVDYVYWEDFGHTWARTWDEVRAVWRVVYLDRSELKARFGGKGGLSKEQINKIPLEWAPKSLNESKIPITRKKAIVYEIWDKQDRCVRWLVKNFPDMLDERDDPLHLSGFFPCPRPLFANLLTDELVPTPNFQFYQDQAIEIDELSTRITAITKALKVAGIYDASATGLDRLLAEGTENQLIPVDGWMKLKEGGGLKGSFELLPLQDIAETLGKLREQRQSLLEDVYQITGLSDIIRGNSDPSETAAAQQIKGQFAVLRISDAQNDVQRFCRDIVRIVGELVSDYNIETLKQISGIKLLTNAEKTQIQAFIKQQQAMQQAAQAAQAAAQHAGPPQGGNGGQPPPGGAPQNGAMHPAAPPAPMQPQPGQAPPSPEKLKLLEEPTWEEIEALLANPVLREFHLDIETDSTIRIDEDADKTRRIELVQSTGAFLQQATQIGASAPELAPLLGELLMFSVRGFRQARSIEQAFDDAMKALAKSASKPKPDPEAAKVQAQVQGQIAVAQVKAKNDKEIAFAQQQAQAQQDAQSQQLEAARKQHEAELTAALKQQETQQSLAHDTQITDLKNHFESQRVQYETAAKERMAQADNQTKILIERMRQEHEAKLETQKQEHEKHIASLQVQAQAHEGAEDRKSAEKTAKKKAAA